MIEKSYIEEITSSYCATEHPEYYIVEVAVHPGNRIVIELGAPTGLSIDACVALSKHIEGKLDREALPLPSRCSVSTPMPSAKR